MLNRPINPRQAEESAAPAQTFESPQAEIRYIQQTDRTLTGFVRVLEIIRDTRCFTVDQRISGLATDWLTSHRPQCGTCVGALLCWFFGGGTRHATAGEYHWYEYGQQALADRLQLSLPKMRRKLVQAMRAAAPGWKPGPYSSFSDCNSDGPFCREPWPVDHADVFRELARRFPGK